MKRISGMLSILFAAMLLLSLAAGCTVASVTTTTAGGGAVAPAEGGGEAPAEGGGEAPAEGGGEAPAEGGGEEAPAEGGGDGKAVVEKICTQCHGLQDITEAGLGTVAGKEFMKGQFMTATARPDWTDTVKRMKDVNACPMTDEEATTVIEWLNANVK